MEVAQVTFLLVVEVEVVVDSFLLVVEEEEVEELETPFIRTLIVLALLQVLAV
jgi:hypothetical protein